MFDYSRKNKRWRHLRQMILRRDGGYCREASRYGKGAGTWLYNMLDGWVDDVIDWIKDFLGIASPSKVMANEVGVWMARGIGSGFAQEMRSVNDQISDSIDTSFDVPAPVPGRRPRSIALATAGGRTVNLTIYTQKLTDADISMLLDLVNDKMGAEL